MKNRKFVVAAFLLAAAMLLGVGYAVLTDTLDITGSADINVTDLEKEYEDEILFIAAKAELPAGITDQNDNPNTASINQDNKDKASFSAKSLKYKDDVAVFTFTIQNNSAYDVTVQPKLNATLGNTNPDWFDITSDWNGQSKVIAAGQSATYKLTVKLKENPTSAISGSFLVELVATADNDNISGGQGAGEGQGQ